MKIVTNNRGKNSSEQKWSPGVDLTVSGERLPYVKLMDRGVYLHGEGAYSSPGPDPTLQREGLSVPLGETAGYL